MQPKNRRTFDIPEKQTEQKMAKRTQRNHAPAFKAKVALAVVMGDRALAELAGQFDAYPNQINKMSRGVRISAREFPQIGDRILCREWVPEDLASVPLLKHSVIDTFWQTRPEERSW